MYYNKVDLCGMNTSKLKTLTSEEKTALLKKAKSGDKKAREELISGNLRLVLSIIQRFGGKSGEADDLFQVGCIGLMKAIDNLFIYPPSLPRAWVMPPSRVYAITAVASTIRLLSSPIALL